MAAPEPVREIFAAAAAGYFPSDEDLDELDVPADVVDEVRSASARIVALRASGDRGAARREAWDARRTVAAMLADDEPEPTEDPQTLANLIPRPR